MNDIREATHQAQALAAAGRMDEATALHRRIVAAFPSSAVASHNLAACLGDSGRWAEAERPARRAIEQGLQAAETWLVLGRALQAQGRLKEAEEALLGAVRRKPLTDAHHDLLQLRWMRTGDIQAGLGELDAALAAEPGAIDLILLKAQALSEAEKGDAALSLLKHAATAYPRSADLLAALSQTAMTERDLALARAAAERALALAPRLVAARYAMVEALLASGDAAGADRVAGEFVRDEPLNQYARALQASAWRALGDPRYQALYDYDQMLCVTEIDAPPGWSSREAYIADLREALLAAHHFQAPPFGQSLREGALIHHVHRLPARAAQALPQALDGPIRRYISALGQGDDPLRARPGAKDGAKDYVFQNIWSVRMQGGARHLNHVHADAWISSALYIEAPSAVAQRPEGWIKFGEPGIRTEPPQPPERHVAPEPGRLLLFRPSCGTAPFPTRATRRASPWPSISSRPPGADDAGDRRSDIGRLGRG
jgi:tetratricopeptide (TPR) repeat protein